MSEKKKCSCAIIDSMILLLHKWRVSSLRGVNIADHNRPHRINQRGINILVHMSILRHVNCTYINIIYIRDYFNVLLHILRPAQIQSSNWPARSISGSHVIYQCKRFMKRYVNDDISMIYRSLTLARIFFSISWLPLLLRFWQIKQFSTFIREYKFFNTTFHFKEAQFFPRNSLIWWIYIWWVLQKIDGFACLQQSFSAYCKSFSVFFSLSCGLVWTGFCSSQIIQN